MLQPSPMVLGRLGRPRGVAQRAACRKVTTSEMHTQNGCKWSFGSELPLRNADGACTEPNGLMRYS